MKKESLIYVAGHSGMVGSAIKRELECRGYNNLLLRTHEELDLTDQRAAADFFDKEKPECVIFCAAKVGGIEANRKAQDEFLYDNVMMAMNSIKAASQNGCRAFMYMGSSCIYPKFAEQPIREESLLSSALEETNEGYALAKICGLKYGEYLSEQCGMRFVSVMPCNLYGKGDTYDDAKSHVIPAMMQRFHRAKAENAPEVICWGDGSPLREFLYADDLASLCVDLMEDESASGLINAGSGSEVTIKELAELIAETVGYEGVIKWDTSMPNGSPRKLLDSGIAASKGWKPAVSLREGLAAAYEDYKNGL